MKCLNLLEVSITSFSALEKLFTSQKLLNCTQRLFVQHLKNQHLFYMPSFSKNCKPWYFLSLDSVRIEKCQFLKDSTCLFYAPNLNFLSITKCPSLEEIICIDKVSDAEAHPEPFKKLDYLSLSDLPSLTSIYQKPLSFPLLTNLVVLNCALLRKLPISHNITNTSKLMFIHGDESWWNELTWDDEVTRDFFLPLFEAHKREK